MKIRLEHKEVGPFHVITSPDVRGFHVSGDTREEAERYVPGVLQTMLRAQGRTIETVAVEVTFSEAVAA